MAMVFDDDPSSADTDARSQPVFQPRLDGSVRAAPYNPKYFYVIGFVGSVGAVAMMALINLRRLPNNAETRTRTIWGLAAMAVLSTAVLFLTPIEWWSPLQQVHSALQVLGVLVGAAIGRVQRGPAFAAIARTGKFASVWRWRPILAIVALVVAVRSVVTVIALIRGVEL